MRAAVRFATAEGRYDRGCCRSNGGHYVSTALFDNARHFSLSLRLIQCSIGVAITMLCKGVGSASLWLRCASVPSAPSLAPPSLAESLPLLRIDRSGCRYTFRFARRASASPLTMIIDFGQCKNFNSTYLVCSRQVPSHLSRCLMP